MIEGFLDRRKGRILLAILVLDAHLGATDLDRTMQGWLEANAIPFLVVATKADRLSESGRATAASEMKNRLRGVPGCKGSAVTSSKTRLGIRHVWGHLDEMFSGESSGTKGERWTSVN